MPSAGTVKASAEHVKTGNGSGEGVSSAAGTGSGAGVATAAHVYSPQ